MNHSILRHTVIVCAIVAAIAAFPGSAKIKGADKAEGPSCHLSGQNPSSVDVALKSIIEKAEAKKKFFTSSYIYI